MSDASHVLHKYSMDCQPTDIESLGAAGGLSGAQFWRVAARRGTLVLRCWPREHPTPARLRWIHTVLQHAARRGVSFLPVPIPAVDGQTFVRHAGHLWELAPWLPGSADYHGAPRPAKLRAALVALARFHMATAEFDGGRPAAAGGAITDDERQDGPRPPSAVVRRLARLRELRAAGVDELSRAVSQDIWPELAPLARRLLDMLPRAVPLAIGRLEPLATAPLALQPCLRDVWHDHVLFLGDEVTGLIDFGAMQVDTPAGDVARLLGSLVADDPANWRLGLDAYITLRPLSPVEIDAVAALDVSGIVLAGCNWLRWIYVDRRMFENRSQVVERLGSLLQRMEIVCNWPLGGSVGVSARGPTP